MGKSETYEMMTIYIRLDFLERFCHLLGSVYIGSFRSVTKVQPFPVKAMLLMGDQECSRGVKGAVRTVLQF